LLILFCFKEENSFFFFALQKDDDDGQNSLFSAVTASFVSSHQENLLHYQLFRKNRFSSDHDDGGRGSNIASDIINMQWGIGGEFFEIIVAPLSFKDIEIL